MKNELGIICYQSLSLRSRKGKIKLPGAKIEKKLDVCKYETQTFCQIFFLEKSHNETEFCYEQERKHVQLTNKFLNEE